MLACFCSTCRTRCRVVVRMKREVQLSLLVLVLVVCSVFLLGLVGVSCEIWTHAALSGAKKVGTKVFLRAIHHSSLWELPLERFPVLERFLRPGI